MPKKREFTEEEVKFIVDNWGVISCYKFRVLLNCSHEALLRIASENNLVISNNNLWTEEEESLLKELSTKMELSKIAKKLGKSKNAVSLKAARMGIVFSCGKRIWTSDDEMQLAKLWGVYSLDYISKKMKRSIPSIKIRAIKLKLGPIYGKDDRYLTITMISNLLNVGCDRIYRTWIKLGLKVRKRKLTEKRDYNYVLWEDLIDFLEKNQNEWDSRNLENYALGEEFSWLQEKRKRDKIENPLWYRKWTDLDIEQIKWLFLVEKKNYQEIAVIMNRKESSVARIIRDLGYQYRLKQYWSGKELLYLKEHCTDMSYNDIALNLGRSERAVKTKLYQMGYKRDKNKKI